MRVELKNQIEVPCTRSGESWKVDLTTLPEGTIQALVWLGLKTRLNEAGNKAKAPGKTDAEIQSTAFALGEAALENLYVHGFSPEQRGKLSEFERECRAISAQAFLNTGKTRTEADKLAGNWRNHMAENSIKQVEALAKKNLSRREIVLDLEINF